VRLFPAELVMRQSSGALKFMSAATYRGLLKGQGIDPDAPAITYCNSGHLSSGPWFLMSELLGNRQVRLYDGSLHQWTLEKRPLVGAVPLN
jgi:thiosulfate/3-mercaptopyruvate sulfurtransferase